MLGELAKFQGKEEPPKTYTSMQGPATAFTRPGPLGDVQALLG